LSAGFQADVPLFTIVKLATRAALVGSTFGGRMMSVRLIESLATTETLAEIFSDRSVLQAMLDFETALARAQAKLKIIPHSVARAVAKAARVESYDTSSLARETLRAGTPGIPLVKALRQRVHQESVAAADFVHWGATSQDVADTALVLLLKKAAPILGADLDRIEKALQSLSNTHKTTVMLGRTLLQAAPPVTFGLKTAGWLGSVRRGRAQLERAFSDALVLQLGGASGTLAALGNRGIEVGELVAKELKLAYPDAPWHAHRDRLAAVLCACGVLTGSLGKMARDIALLMQSEVAEVAEPGGSGRGGSSTMPQKRNPIASTIALAAANRVPAFVAAFLSQMVQEHERGVGGWQAEWPTVAAVIQSTGVTIASMAETVEGLTVDDKRMADNLDATRGSIFAEKAAMILSRKIGREAAHKILEQATDSKLLRDRRLTKVLSEMPGVLEHFDHKALSRLEDPQDYLGMAAEFTNRISRSAGARPRHRK
jgi:3-carboxy-cis,cis-muconate cycloisomerase